MLGMDVFQALADPTRRAILTMLAPGERSAGEIMAAFSISCPAVSQHLKVLREAHLVRVRIAAQRRIYQLDPAGLSHLTAWLFRVHSTEGSERTDAPKVVRAVPSTSLSVAAVVQGRRIGALVA